MVFPFSISGGSASAPFLVSAIALARFDDGFRVLLSVLCQRTTDVGFFIKATLIVTPHETFVLTGID
jgi:hypothetical protein